MTFIYNQYIMDIYLINPKKGVKWRATLRYITCTSFSINLLVQINNISIHIMVQRINNFSTIRTEQCNMINAKSWAKRVYSIIDHLCFRDARINFNVNMSSFNLFKARLCDQLVQVWQSSINSMSKLNYYVKYKKTFQFEPYLNSIDNYMIRKCLTCFR